MKTRKNRLEEIIDILSQHNISCQEELSKQLAVRGFIVTQATLSRDLKKLRTTKVADDLGGYKYIVTDSSVTPSSYPSNTTTVQSSQHPAAVSLAVSGNIVIIKTRNGYAGGLAYDLDMLKSPLILGTIPGADTVMAVVREGTSRGELFELFKDFLPAKVIREASSQFAD